MTDLAVAPQTDNVPATTDDVDIFAPTPRRDLKALTWMAGLGLWFALGALLSVYIDLRSDNPVWPPKGIYPDNYSAVMITFTLLLGSFMVEWAARSARNEERGVLAGLFMTTGFGLAALNGLAFAFNRFNFGIPTNEYGSVVYALLIVVFGSIALATLLCLVNGIRALNERTGGDFQARIRATATLWHLVFVGWFFVYAVVYLVK